MTPKKKSLSYRDAGVDIDAGNALVTRIKSAARQTHRKEVMSGPGGFAALCQIPAGYHEPVLVSGTDGVGTKLKLAIELDLHDGLGIDLVAMCVNDLVVCGAEPLFFLDYYATAQLDVEVAARVIEGIARGCQLAGCALVGGETAEMPGMYQPGEYDLAGFCVGVVEKQRVVDGRHVQHGDVLIGLASSGAHANGYSLIRKILSHSAASLETEIEGRLLREILLQPTRIYVDPVRKLAAAGLLKAASHITGGGLLENVPRTLPEHLCAVIDSQSWPLPALFSWLKERGNIDSTELYRTFNCGIGMVVAVAANRTDEALQLLSSCGETAWPIGQVRKADAQQDRLTLTGLS